MRWIFLMGKAIDREPTEEELDMVRRVAWGMAKRYRIQFEDALSDGMYGLVKGLRRMKDEETRGNFLYQKVKWEIFSQMRQRVRRHRDLEVSWPSRVEASGECVLAEFPSEDEDRPPMSDEDLRAIRVISEGLPHRWRRVLALVGDGHTVAEACRVHGLHAPNFVREMVKTARRVAPDLVGRILIRK